MALSAAPAVSGSGRRLAGCTRGSGKTVTRRIVHFSDERSVGRLAEHRFGVQPAAAALVGSRPESVCNLPNPNIAARRGGTTALGEGRGGRHAINMYN